MWTLTLEDGQTCCGLGGAWQALPDAALELVTKRSVLYWREKINVRKYRHACSVTF